MWKSAVQYKWEEAAKEIGIEIKENATENIFIDYWELSLDSKVEDLEEEIQPGYKIKFYKEYTTYKKKRCCKTKWTHKKSRKTRK